MKEPSSLFVKRRAARHISLQKVPREGREKRKAEQRRKKRMICCVENYMYLFPLGLWWAERRGAEGLLLLLSKGAKEMFKERVEAAKADVGGGGRADVEALWEGACLLGISFLSPSLLFSGGCCLGLSILTAIAIASKLRSLGSASAYWCCWSWTWAPTMRLTN